MCAVYEDNQEDRKGCWGLNKLGMWPVTCVFRRSGEGDIGSLSCATMFRWTRESIPKGKYDAG